MEPSRAVLGGFMSHLGPSWAILGPLRAILAVLEACGAMFAAWVAFLGCLGAVGKPQGGPMAAQGPPRVGGMHAARCWGRGWDPLEDDRNPSRQHLGFFHASTCQGARWRISFWARWVRAGRD